MENERKYRVQILWKRKFRLSQEVEVEVERDKDTKYRNKTKIWNKKNLKK